MKQNTENKMNFLQYILYFLIMLYPVLPLNRYIFIFSYANLCSVLIVLIYILCCPRLRKINILTHNAFHWIYFIVYAIFAFITQSVSSGIAIIFSDILVGFILIQLVTTETKLFRIIDLIIITSFALSFIGIYESISNQYLFQAELFEEWTDSVRYGILRCSGPFGHPINYAFFQAIAALLIFYRINSGRLSHRRKVLFSLIYILDVVSMFLAVSRLAICFFVMAQVILILHLRPRRLYKYITIAVFGVVVALFLIDIIGFTVSDLFGDLITSFLQLFGLESSTNSTNTDVLGFGNRFDLYAWVIAAVGDNYLLGNGVGAEFSYKLTDWFTKTSIEVQYLYVYFRCGLVGLTSLVLAYIGTIRYLVRRGKCFLQSEYSINFLYVLSVILILYYISLFGVQESDLTRLYCELVCLGIASYRIYKNQQKNSMGNMGQTNGIKI